MGRRLLTLIRRVAGGNHAQSGGERSGGSLGRLAGRTGESFDERA
jgi:hypothetical protein